MKLNRWTILAVILLLFTVAALMFRPWGDGFEGQQVVAHRELVLTCPESLTAAFGETRTVHCEFTQDSENLDDYRLRASGDIEEIAPGRYTLTQEFKVDSSGSHDVTLDRTVTSEAILRMRDNMADPRLRRTAAHPVATIDVQIRFHPVFYAGLGLTWLLTLILVGGPPVAVAAWMLRRIQPTVLLLDKANLALNESTVSDWLVRPWRFAVSIRSISNSQPKSVLSGYLATDTLWNLYYLMAILVIPFRVSDIIFGETADWPAAGFDLTLAILISIIAAVVLFIVRNVTFFGVVSPYWGLVNSGNVEQELPKKWVNSLPFAITALVGFIGLPQVATYYWVLWL